MYQFKNWKLICEEKDREIARLKEEMERVKRVERLTEKDGKWIGCKLSDGEKCPPYELCKCEHFHKMRNKLAEYEDLEEQGLLLKPPCAIGDDVYMITSKVNYDLNVLSKHEENNRVCHQKVANIVFTPRGWYLTCNKDMYNGTGRVLVDIFFKETWFLDEAEAEKALEEMEK